MNRTCFTSARCWAGGLLLTVAGSGAVHAAVVVLNADGSQFTPTAVAMDSRYRISQTNWDQMIATSTVISGSTIVQQKFLGDAATLNNRAWDFSVNYVAGSGYSFTLTDTTVPPLISSPSTVSWTAPFGSPSISPTRSYNAIELFAQAQNNLQTGVTGLSISLNNLVFSGGPGLSTSGALVSMSDTHLLSPGPGGADYAQQWLVADGDLSLFNWAITGQVQAQFTGTVPNNFDERLKFDIKTVQVSPVPLPPALALMLAGLGALGWVGRRRAAAAL